MTNVCCESSLRDATHREYKVTVISDACAAQPYPDMGWGALTAREVQRVTLTIMAHQFAEVTDTQDLIGRLSGQANWLLKGPDRICGSRPTSTIWTPRRVS